MQNKKYFLIVTLFLLVLSACSPESKIIGTWYDEYGTEINFFKDGTFIVKDTLINFTGDYRFVDKETLILDSEGIIGLFGSQIFTVEVSQGEIYLDDGGSGLTLYNEKPDFSNQSSDDSISIEIETEEENDDNLGSETPELASLPRVFWELELHNTASVNKYVEELFYSMDNSWDIDFITEELAESQNYFTPIYPRSYSYDSDAVYFTNHSDHPSAYAIDDGSELWVSDMEGSVVGCGQETVFVFTSNNRIYGLDKKNGQERWKIIIDSLLSADEESDPFPIVIEADNLYYVPLSVEYKIYDYSTRFLKFNESDGSAELTLYNPELARTIEPFMIKDDTLIGIDNDLIISIDINDGSLNWVWGDNDRHEGRFDIEIIHGFDQKDNILYFEYDYGEMLDYNPCTFGCLLALDLTSGSSKWDEPLSVIGPEFGKQFDTFYVFNDYIYQVYYQEVQVFDKGTGNFLNSYLDERYLKVLPGEKHIIIYIPDLGIAQCIDPVTNEVLWEDDEFLYERGLYTFEDVLIYIDEEYDLVGLDFVTGDQIWKIKGQFGLAFRYAIYDDLLIHKEWNDHLELINLNTGSITDIYTGGGWGNDSDEHFQVIDNNSWLYFGDYLALIKHK